MMQLDWLRDLIVVPVLTMARLAACFIVAPFFPSQLITGTIRNGIVLSCTLVLYPMLAPALTTSYLSPVHAALLLGKEVVLGLLIGFLAGAPFWIANGVGFLVDNQRGTGMAQIFDPNLGTQTSPLGALLLEVVVVFFYTSGGFFLFLSMMFESYRLMPVGTFFPAFTAEFPNYIFAFADRLMRLTVVIAAPMVIAMFLVDFGLGLVNRFAPSLNVFFLSMPVKSALSILVLIFFTATMMVLLEREFIDIRQLRSFFFIVD